MELAKITLLIKSFDAVVDLKRFEVTNCGSFTWKPYSQILAGLISIPFFFIRVTRPVPSKVEGTANATMKLCIHVSYTSRFPIKYRVKPTL